MLEARAQSALDYVMAGNLVNTREKSLCRCTNCQTGQDRSLTKTDQLPRRCCFSLCADTPSAREHARM